MMRMRPRTGLAWTIVTLAILIPATARAQGGWGLRLGVADDPDQVVAGVQLDIGEVATGWQFRPDLELGVGDDHTVLAACAPLHYRFDVGEEFVPYAGGGVTVGFIDRDLPGTAGDGSDFELALEAIGGIEWELPSGRAFSIELNIVVGDLHDLEVLAGWRF